MPTVTQSRVHLDSIQESPGAFTTACTAPESTLRFDLPTLLPESQHIRQERSYLSDSLLPPGKTSQPGLKGKPLGDPLQELSTRVGDGLPWCGATASCWERPWGPAFSACRVQGSPHKWGLRGRRKPYLGCACLGRSLSSRCLGRDTG